MATNKTDTKHSVEAQIAEYEAKIKELRQSQLAEYEAELETVSTRASELRQLISGIKGTPVEHQRTRGPRKEKQPGKQISAVRIAELVKEAGGELNLRKGGYDVAQVRKVVGESGGKFKMAGKNPWPTVVAV